MFSNSDIAIYGKGSTEGSLIGVEGYEDEEGLLTIYISLCVSVSVCLSLLTHTRTHTHFFFT